MRRARSSQDSTPRVHTYSNIINSMIKGNFNQNKRIPYLLHLLPPHHSSLPYMYKNIAAAKLQNRNGSRGKGYRQSLYCLQQSLVVLFLFFAFVYVPYATCPIGLSSSIPGAIRLVRGSPVSLAAEQRAMVGELLEITSVK